MLYWNDVYDLMNLFSIDTEKEGAKDFATLVELLALMEHWPQYGVSVGRLSRLAMSQIGLSPRIYWSRMKRAISPLITADRSTLRSLGIRIMNDDPLTCPVLAQILAQDLTQYVTDDKAEIAAQIAEEVRRFEQR